MRGMWMGSCVLLVALCTVAQAEEGRRAAPGGGTLLVVNQGDHTLSVIDAASGKTAAAIDVGGVTGHEVAVTPDGRTAFVAIYGNSGVGRPGTDGKTISVIDLATRKISGRIDFPHGVRPHCLVFDPVTGLLEVTTELDKTITMIDPKTLKVVGTVPTGQEESHMLALSHDGSTGYTANVHAGTVSILDMRGKRVVAVVPVAPETQRIALSVDGKSVYTADQTKPELVVIDTAKKSVARRVALPGIGYGTASTLDGRWLLVALRTTGRVAVLDTRTMAVAYVLDLPGVPTEILVRPDGLFAYVSCGKKVGEIDLTTWKVARLIDAREGADGLAWSSSGLPRAN